MDPPEKVPPGVVFGIKHFLTVPNSLEIQETVGKSGGISHRHYVIRLIKANGKHELEEIDYMTNISSPYFTTAHFAGRSLCKVTSAWLPWGPYECYHSSLKKLIITKRKSKCPHEKHSLYLWCVCTASEREFEKAIEERGEEKTTAITTLNLKQSADCTYNVSVRLSGNSEAGWDTRWTSHLKMCERNGFMDLATLDQNSGYIEGEFGCGCHSDDLQHCRRAADLAVKIEEKRGDQPLVKSLLNKTDLDCQEQQLSRPVLPGSMPDEQDTVCVVDADREALRRVLKKQIPKTHRPGDVIGVKKN